MAIFVGIVGGFVLYAPIGVYVFDLSLVTLFERLYFAAAGAAIALYVPRAKASPDLKV